MKTFAKTFAFCLLICGLLAQSAFALAAGVESKTAKIGGNSATLLYITMDGKRSGEVTVGYNSVNKDMSAAEHVASKNAEDNKTVVASINGGFFNAYYDTKKALTFPDNCAHIYAAIVQNGEVVNAGGTLPTIAFTADGKVLIDRVKIETSVTFRGNENNKVTAWSVNGYYADATAVMLFTDKLGYPVNVPGDAKMVFIRDNVVTDIRSGSELTVPGGTCVLVYQPTAWANAEQWGSSPRVGNFAEISTVYTPSKAGTESQWTKITSAIGAGPWLISNGADVTSENSNFSDPKQGMGVVSARSFAAVLPDGRLILGAATASMQQITSYLLSIGAADAIALDGGASSMLYNGSKYARAAGRKLSNVLHIVDYANGQIPQPPAKPDRNAPSDWAKRSVETARSKGIIPAGIDKNYRMNVTREEFCMLAVQTMKQCSPTPYAELVNATGISYDAARASFTDTYNLEVLDCYRLGIVNGKGNNLFDPNGTLTREQAAKILAKTAQLLGKTADGEAIAFADAASISAWAVGDVDWVCKAGMMNGVSGGRFDPQGYFTKEQAVVTLTRILPQ